MADRDVGERPTRRRVLRLAFEIGALALGVHLLIPQLAGLEATGVQLARATVWLPAAVIALEGASLWAYGELILTGLRAAGERAPRGLVQRSVWVGTSLGRTLPAGNAAAFAVTVGALRRAGVDPVRAATSMATSGLLSSVVLAGLLPFGVALTLTTGHLGGIALSASVAAVVILVAAGLTPWASRRPDAVADRARQLATALARGPLRRRLDPDAIAEVVRRGVDGVRQLAADGPTLAAGGAWATANWLFDVAVVLVLATTIGHGTPLAPLLMAYIVAQLAAAIPLTPGGVGVVETAMVAALVASGAPAAAATVTVLGWRLVSHWLPIAVGLALLPTVTGRSRRRPRPATTGEHEPSERARRRWPARAGRAPGGRGRIVRTREDDVASASGWAGAPPRIGDTASRSRRVTAGDIEAFTALSGDRNPLHYDADFARATRFGEIVVQGGVTTAILNAVVAEDLPGPGTVFLELNLRFLAPVRPGDTITGEVVVAGVRDDKPITRLDVRVVRDDGTVAVAGAAVCYTAAPTA